MEGVYESIIEKIGNTPLIHLARISSDARARIYGKAEHLNPAGSVKDRLGLAIIEEAERSGKLKPGGVIVEGTGGNTGLALAMVAAHRGYRAIFTMPDKMSQEKVRFLKSFGAKVIVTPSAVPPDSPDYYVNVAKRIADKTPNAIYANQFYNPINPDIHYRTTGKEIWEQAEGNIDYFVAGMGTGGTVSGVGRYLKEQKPEVQVIVADPEGSIIKDYFYTKRIVESRPWKVEGIGEDMIPPNHHYQYVDDVVQVSDRESFQAARRLAREEGILVGGSSGTILAAALKVARNLSEPKTFVIILCDSGDRYLSKFHSDEWMKENRFLEDESRDQIEVDIVISRKSTSLPALIQVGPKSTVAEVLDLMDEYNVSQIPVLEGNRALGNVTEGRLTRLVLEDRKALELPVSQLMEKPLPVIDSTEPVENVMKLLRHRERAAVLVKRHEVLVGLVTRHDLIHYLTD